MKDARDVLKEMFLKFADVQRISKSYDFGLLNEFSVYFYPPKEWITHAAKMFNEDPANEYWKYKSEAWQKYLDVVQNHYDAQPQPTKGQKEVLPELIKDLRKRQKTGKVKYGTNLKTNNGRDALIDAYQEACDLAMYLKQKLMEGGG